MGLATIEWLAVERYSRLVVGFHIGGRNQEVALGLWLSITKKSHRIHGWTSRLRERFSQRSALDAPVSARRQTSDN